MKHEEARERFRRKPAAGGEAPTEAASLSISVVPAAITTAEPPVAAVAEPGEQDHLTTVTGASRFRKDRSGGRAIGNRIRAAIEAEAAAVPAANPEVIETELARIMSRRPSREAPEQPGWSRPYPAGPPSSNPADYELTAAADLRIRLVPT